MSHQRLLTPEEVAELCATSTQTVKYWRRTGTGPLPLKIGRRVRYDSRDVESWLEEQRQQANQDNRRRVAS